VSKGTFRAAIGAKLVASTVVEGQVGRSRSNLTMVQRFLYCRSCRVFANQTAVWTGVTWRHTCPACGIEQDTPEVRPQDV
jgi:hypothetical protein